MAAVKRRKVDDIPHGDRGLLSKRRKQRLSSEPSTAIESTSPGEVEVNGHAPKSFQDLGIIQSLCDACKALGFKVPTSSKYHVPFSLKPLGPDSDTNRSDTIGSPRKGPHRPCRDWQRENGRVRTSNSTRWGCGRDYLSDFIILTSYQP